MVLREPIHRQLALAATAFFVFGFGLQLWRLEGFSASYDQGLFLQELWSGSQGRWFESTLSAELSAAVKLGGNCPSWAICMPASTSICLASSGCH